MLIYSDPLHFPPTINAANILAEKGASVYLLGYDNTDNWSQQTDNRINFISLGNNLTGWRGVLQYLGSIRFLRRFLRKNNIQWLISYDAKSVWPSRMATKNSNTKWIYHQHDFWEHPTGLWGKFLWNKERSLARYADYVSFPQQQRADYFKTVAHLKTDPLIIFNGPRKNWTDLAVKEDPVITELKKKFSKILIYQGGWSKYFALERLFNALAISNKRIALVVLGEEREKGIRDHYKDYLLNLGISERVYLAEKYIPYESVPGFTKYCDAAIGKLTGDDDDAPFNDRYLAGAANKITEYIACGLPVILQDAEANKAFLKKYPVGILVSTKETPAFANMIDTLLFDEDRLKEIRSRNKRIFLEGLNFDKQFDRIVEVIE